MLHLACLNSILSITLTCYCAGKINCAGSSKGELYTFSEPQSESRLVGAVDFGYQMVSPKTKAVLVSSYVTDLQSVATCCVYVAKGADMPDYKQLQVAKSVVFSQIHCYFCYTIIILRYSVKTRIFFTNLFLFGSVNKFRILIVLSIFPSSSSNSSSQINFFIDKNKNLKPKHSRIQI